MNFNHVNLSPYITKFSVLAFLVSKKLLGVPEMRNDEHSTTKVRGHDFKGQNLK